MNRHDEAPTIGGLKRKMRAAAAVEKIALGLEHLDHQGESHWTGNGNNIALCYTEARESRSGKRKVESGKRRAEKLGAPGLGRPGQGNDQRIAFPVSAIGASGVGYFALQVHFYRMIVAMENWGRFPLNPSV